MQKGNFMMNCDSVGSVHTHLYSVNIRQRRVREQVSLANSLDSILIMNGSSGTAELRVDQSNTWIDAINNKGRTFSLSSWHHFVYLYNRREASMYSLTWRPPLFLILLSDNNNNSDLLTFLYESHNCRKVKWAQHILILSNNPMSYM